MNSENKKELSKNKDQNKFKKKKIDDEKNDLNFFKVMKEVEKEQKSKESPAKTIKITSNNLTEKIYLNNSDKLGNYYNTNKNELKLIGSKKFKDVNILKLIEVMKKNNPKMLEKIKEYRNKKKQVKNFGFESCDEKIMLTPLAQTEKEEKEFKNLSENMEKKKFEEAQRRGVVNRKIEYVHFLDNRDPYKKVDTSEEDKMLFILISEAVDKIERNWLLYKYRKQKLEQQQKENEIPEEQKDTINISEEKENEDEKDDKKEKEEKKENEEKNDDFKKTKNDIINDSEENNKEKDINEEKEKEMKDMINEVKIDTSKLKGIKKNILSNSNEESFLQTENFFIEIIKNKNNKISHSEISKTFNLSYISDNKQKEKIEKLESKCNEAKNNYIKVKTQLEKNNLENIKYKNQISEVNNELQKLNEEIINIKKEKEKLIKNNKELNNKLNTNKKEFDELNQTHNSLNKTYNELLENFNKVKNDLNNALDNNILMSNEINNLNETKKEQNLNNENINNELLNTKNILEKLTKEKNEKEEELNNIKLDLEQKLNKINSQENEINNLKTQMTEKDIINKENNEKNMEEYKNNLLLLEKQKEELQNTNNILEELSNTNKEKYTKLFFQNKNIDKKHNKEKEELKKEINKLKQKLDLIKTNKELEKNEFSNLINTKDKYEKKIITLNKIISELKQRIQDIYYQLSFLQKNTKFNQPADIILKIKLMVLLTKNCIDKKIIFDKREFFNILTKKYKNKYYSREKRIEFLRERNKLFNFPF